MNCMLADRAHIRMTSDVFWADIKMMAICVIVRSAQRASAVHLRKRCQVFMCKVQRHGEGRRHAFILLGNAPFISMELGMQH